MDTPLMWSFFKVFKVFQAIGQGKKIRLGLVSI